MLDMRSERLNGGMWRMSLGRETDCGGGCNTKVWRNVVSTVSVQDVTGPKNGNQIKFREV